MNECISFPILAFSFFILISFTIIDGQGEGIIIEGKSVDQIQVGMTVNQVQSILESDGKKIEWAKYSYEYKFEKGISVWEKQDDSTHTVFSISIDPKKWKGRTSKGLTINENLTIKNVLEIYGRPEWGYTSDCSELDAEYYDNGICFSVDTIYGVCDETELGIVDETSINHDSLYSDMLVVGLTIGEIGTFY